MSGINVGRRRIVAAIGASIASPWVGAGTLIEGAESTGTGIDNTAARTELSATARTSQVRKGVSQDWREGLLDRDRSLWVIRRDTKESSRVVYWRPGSGYDRDAYINLCYLLRDVKANRVSTMDPSLLDLLCGMQSWLNVYGHVKPIVVLSGFRTFATNNAIEGAELTSKHLTGQAADIYIPGLSQSTLGSMALLFNNGKRGGVGFYPNNGFVHVDSGPLRQWTTTQIRRHARS